MSEFMVSSGTTCSIGFMNGKDVKEKNNEPLTFSGYLPDIMQFHVKDRK